MIQVQSVGYFFVTSYKNHLDEIKFNFINRLYACVYKVCMEMKKCGREVV